MGCFFGLRDEGIVNLVLVLVFLATVLVQTCTVSQTPDARRGRFWPTLTCTKWKQDMHKTKTSEMQFSAISSIYSFVQKQLVGPPDTCTSHLPQK